VNSVGRRYGRGLVIGGGIAGPVVGMALQRVGIQSAIFEASPGPSDGAFLTVASNGIDALQAIDAHRPVVAAGIRTERMVLSSGRGKFLGAIEAGVPLTDGSTTTTIDRACLYRLLHDEARRRRIPIVHGKRLVAIEETSAGVVARFADGSAERAGSWSVRTGSGPRPGASSIRTRPAPSTPGSSAWGAVHAAWNSTQSRPPSR
jgi:2-polyprenyl-6-methoxyphenol hydroxylase-like FAD-dependent oxidoreductase